MTTCQHTCAAMLSDANPVDGENRPCDPAAPAGASWQRERRRPPV
jgi:Mg-chelatase subunit ChlI